MLRMWTALGRVIILLALLLLPGSSGAGREGQCAALHFDLERDTLKGYALEGFTFRVIRGGNFEECLQECLHECKCLALQLSGNENCELLHEDSTTKPHALVRKTGYRYFNVQREFMPKQVMSQPGAGKIKCSNNCCESQPCLNGAQCTEHCQESRYSFICSCQEGYTGKFCMTRANTCKDYADEGSVSGVPTSGIYILRDITGKTFEVFCDFDSEKGFAWTLIESFSFSNNGKVQHEHFSKDKPYGENGVNWELFRLPLIHMKSIAEQSTYFRATCNFPAGLDYSDYLRAKLFEVDIFHSKNDKDCEVMEKVYVRGFGCESCTADFPNNVFWHPHIATSSRNFKCQLDAPVSVIGPLGEKEHDFGHYTTRNTKHKCVEFENSTTQWWFG